MYPTCRIGPYNKIPKNNKATGVDEISAELLKYTGVDIKNKLYKICNEINLSGVISKKGIIVLIFIKRKGYKNHHPYNQEQDGKMIDENLGRD